MILWKCQGDWSIETDVMDELVLMRFEFEISFRRISYIAQPLLDLVVALKE